MIKGFFWINIAFFILLPMFAFAALEPNSDPVKIGVLAYRPIPETLAQWEPLEGYLKKQIPERNFVIQPLKYDSLEAAVATRQVDFILTNPGSYIQLKQNYNLSSPLASLIKQSQQRPVTAFAGVIFALASNTDINELKDLTGKRIAAAKKASLGGYQMQSFALFSAGLPVPQGESLYLTGMPHDNVVNAVLTGKADVGFVRTGVLESLQREQGLDLSRIKIINAQNIPSFPFKLSTRLYPEWPIAALPHIDQELASHFTAAMLLMHDDEVCKTIGIKGFRVPLDYSPVQEVLRTLRLPPFEAAPDFTVHDIWHQYLIEIVLGFILLVVGSVITVYLVLFNRRLTIQKQQISEEAYKHHRLLSSLAEGVYGVDSKGLCIFINPAALTMFGYTEKEVIGKNQHELFHHHKENGSVYPEQECPITQTINDSKYRICEELFWRKEGGSFPVVVNISELQISSDEQGAVVAFRDITMEKQMTERNDMLVAALEASQTSVVITDKQARIEWVNPAFEKLTGYSSEEAIGRNPTQLVESGVQDDAFYQALWKTILSGESWQGEIVSRRKGGDLYDEELNISPVLDRAGEIQHFIAAKNDISKRKQIEKRLQHMAKHDQLTLLPNRTLLSDLLEQSISIAKRNKQHLALMFLDLDKFKPVNDDYGHDAGDALLKQVAVRITDCLRESDTVARVGGDEFIILLTNVSGQDDAMAVAEKVRAALNHPFQYKQYQLQISSSIGVAMYPDHGEAEIMLAKNADLAMYFSKENGRNNVQIFNPLMVRD